MRQFLCLAVLVSLGSVPLVWGDAPAKKAAPPTVEQLIDRLSDKDPDVRERAGKALAALGKEALPALVKARAHADPEVRRRLEELIPPLERAQLLTPKHVSLHMTGKPIREILAEVGKQTGYKILTYPEEQPLGQRDKVVYTFHFDKLPFWEALDKICEATGMTLQQYWSGDDALHLYGQDTYVPYFCYSGPFKVIATGFNYGRSNNFGQLPKNPPPQNQQQPQEYLNMSISVVTEPRLPILSVGQVKLLAAEDDEHHSMMPKSVQPDNNNPWGYRGMWWGGFYRNFYHQTQASLAWPSKTAKTVKHMKGTIPVTLLADQKPSIVTDKILASKNKKFKVGNATFHVLDVNGAPGKQYTIRLGVTENSKENPNDYSRIQSMQQRLEIQDDKGNKHPCNANVTSWTGPNQAEFQLMIQPTNAKIGPPTKLVYYAWVLMQHELAFEFKDVPLP